MAFVHLSPRDNKWDNFEQYESIVLDYLYNTHDCTREQALALVARYKSRMEVGYSHGDPPHSVGRDIMQAEGK